jgi:hypothetical protein
MRPADDRRRAVARAIGDESWSSPIGIKRNISAPAPAAAPDAMDFRPPIGHGAARAETAGIRDL